MIAFLEELSSSAALKEWRTRERHTVHRRLRRRNPRRNDFEPYPIMLMSARWSRQIAPASQTHRSPVIVYSGSFVPSVNIHERYIWSRLLLQSCLRLGPPAPRPADPDRGRPGAPRVSPSCPGRRCSSSTRPRAESSILQHTDTM